MKEASIETVEILDMDKKEKSNNDDELKDK